MDYKIGQYFTHHTWLLNIWEYAAIKLQIFANKRITSYKTFAVGPFRKFYSQTNK